MLMRPAPSLHRLMPLTRVGAVVVSGLLQAFSLAAQPLDVLQTWRLAQSHDPQLAAAQAQRDQALVKREQMAPLWETQTRAVLTAGVGGQDAHLTNARAMGQHHVDFDASINVGGAARAAVGGQKPIRNPALTVQSQMLDTAARMGEVQWAQANLDVAWRSVQRYFDLLAARQTVEVLQKQLETVMRAQKEIMRRKAIGDATTMDVQEAQTRVALLRAQLLQAQHDADTQALAYRQLTGQTPTTLRGVVDKPVVEAALQQPLSSWVMQAQTQSTAMQLAELQIGLQEDEAKRVRLASTASTVDWVGQAQLDRLTGWGMSGTATQQLAGYRLGVQWQTPLGTQNLTLAREKEAFKQADQLRSEKAWKQAQLETQVHEAWQALQSALARMQALHEAYTVGQQRVRTTRQAHQLGTRSTLEWLGAEQDATQAELLWRSARIHVVVAQARLYWVSGELGSAQLQALNQHLQ